MSLKNDGPGDRSDLILRAGAVLRRGYAVLVPSPDDGHSGTSRLVAALVRAGAELIADGSVCVDDRGRIRVPPSVASATAAPPEAVDLALIVATTYQPGAPWRPQTLYGARAALPMLERAAAMSGSWRQLLRLAAQLTPRLTTLSGPRPDADQVAPQILAYLDEILEGRPPRRAHERGRQGTAPAARDIAPPAEVLGTASPAAERALLRRHPSLLLLYWYGRFGNRMHQYAYGVTYARLNKHRFWTPSEWEGTHLFETPHHAVLPRGRLRTALSRSRDQFDHPERRFAAVRAVVPEARLIRPTNQRQNYAGRDTVACVDDTCAYHPSIFSSMSRAHLLSVFQIAAAVKQLDLYKRLEDRQGTYDIAHLRRDDISNPRYNQTHFQAYSVISTRSYDAAFTKFGFDPAAVEWVSDDRSGRWHVNRPQRVRGTWRYPAGSQVLPGVLFDWLEDFLRLYFARTIFRANSSFSWWAAFLSPGARVFSPVIDKRHIYGVDGLEEIDVDFVEGNHPHWMFGNADIRIGA